jgi:ubiquinone/menaquinone biosynthesis C-methylase UbiE
MKKTHWADRSQHWGKIGPPLQPNQEVIDAFTALIPADKKILMLGVTPQIANAYQNVTAIDFSPGMIERVWPGNTDTKHAIEDDWLTVGLDDNQFEGLLGDGSINMVGYPDDIKFLFERSYRWLKPDGTFAMRFFTRPTEPVTREQLIEEASNPTVGFSAFRRLLPMYVAVNEGNSCIRQSRVLEVFDEMFPDRSVLKWDPEHMKTMDSYKDTTTTSWFPTREEILEFVHPDAKNVRFIDVGTYDIADTCPILTFTK